MDMSNINATNNLEDELFRPQTVETEEQPQSPQELVTMMGEEYSEERLAELQKTAEEQYKFLKENKKVDEKGNVSVPLVVAAENKPEKKYLILITGVDKDDMLIKDWEEVEGRESAYETIISYMDEDNNPLDKDMEFCIDLLESKIVVSVETIGQAKSVYDFLDFVAKNRLMGEDYPYPDLSEWVDPNELEAIKYGEE